MIQTGVVVVTFNGAAWIRQCIGSLQNGTRQCRIVIVDNCSSDNTADIVKVEFPQVELIRMPRNAGFGVGNNVGISVLLRAGYKYIMLLNQDAYAMPDSIEHLEEVMDEDPDLGVTSPVHCSPDETTIDRKTYEGYLRVHAEQYLCDAVKGEVQRTYDIYGMNAAAWMVRSEVFRQVGGFDPLFFMYGEDDDLLARFAYHRVRFGLVTTAKVVHLRQSPPSLERDTTWNRFRKRRLRFRSVLLARCKRPGFGAVQICRQLIAHGVIGPLANLVVEQKWSEYFASVAASASILGQLPAVVRHARVSGMHGPHFLNNDIGKSSRGAVLHQESRPAA